jgi:hypothetical protein
MTVDTVANSNHLTGPGAGLSAPSQAHNRGAEQVRNSYGHQKDPKKSSTKTVRQIGLGCSYQ